MSIVTTATGLVLVVFPGLDISVRGIGVTLILTVQGYWFVSGSVKQVAGEVVSQMNQHQGPNVISPPAPVLTVTQPAPILTMTQPAAMPTPGKEL